MAKKTQNQNDVTISDEVNAAVALLEDNFIQISEVAELFGTSYMYTRNMITQDRYGLGTSTIEVHGRLLVSKVAAENAFKVREERKAEKEAKAAAKTRKAEPEAE